ncbi:MAG: radical SAM/SPASM family putative metalloenzyme maturase, partial [Geopsychrobacter sp.]|nr:radical SAM/SPASM family putative metalloenzyme maturase [Geopsychrobacter sp.]
MIWQNNIDSDQVIPVLRDYPTKLFVEVTTRCNLGCAMCVKQSGDCGISEGMISLETFKGVEPGLPFAEALILNGVGEPLLHPELETFIVRAKALMSKQSWIGFQSNGLLLDEQRAFSLLEAGLDRICISVDTLTPETLQRMREGVEISDLSRAFDALGKARLRLNRTDFQVGVEIVVMRGNLDELPATLQWAASHGATFALVTHVLPYDDTHIDDAVYESCSGQAIDLLQKWREKATEAGVDIDHYPRILWNYSKDAIAQRIIDFVERLKADAEEQGVFLDLKKLFQVDVRRLEQVEKVFARAAQVAVEEGLELTLPQLVLKETRRCEFVEDGSAFVSWQGDVHPCYFLWHGYNCYASGWQQLVKPKIFGNLAQQPILDIWNSAGFKTFRENVSRYDYPYCAGCGLAPCDYIQTDEFEQDCHINQEPCG